MKILQIIPDFGKGGAERLVIDIVRELSLRPDVVVKVVTFRDLSKYDLDSIRPYINIIPSSIEFSILSPIKYHVSALQDFIESFQPDIINSHLTEAEFVSRSVYYPKAKWFSHCHDNMTIFKNDHWRTYTDKKNLIRTFEKRYLLKRYDKNGGNHFIAVSRKTQEYFKENLPTKYPVTLLPNAIDLSRVEPAQDRTAKNKLTLINIGSFVPNKNQKLLIKILQEITARGIDCECIFLGSGPEEENVKKLAREMGLQDKVRFQGNVEYVSIYLSQSDICVHTSFSESFGLVLIEAMAMKVPVVSLDNGGSSDIIQNGINGYILPEPDAAAFADRIIDLYQNKDLYASISESGLASTKKYSITKYVSELLSIYKAAL